MIMESSPGKAGGGAVGLSTKQSWRGEDLKTRLMRLEIQEPRWEPGKIMPILLIRNRRFREGKRLAQVIQ